MSVAGAIKAGSAFVEFTGDLSALMRASKEAGSYLGSWASKVSNQASTQIASGYADAANATTQFGNQAGAATAKASSGLSGVITKTAALTTGIFTLGGGFSALKSGAGSLMGLMGGLSGLAKLTGSLSWGLRGVSLVMKLMGKDASHLEPWIKNLWRASWATWAMDKALKAARLSAAALRAAVNAPMNLARMAGRGLSGLGRFGALGGAATAVAVAGEEGEGVSTSKAVGGGALAGLMMGGLAGAGIGAAAAGLALTIRTALSRGTAEGARESKDFLTQLGVAMVDAGAFISATWTRISDKVRSVFASMKTEGPSVFERIKTAIFPIVDAVENVWLPAMFGAIDSIADYFRSGTQQMGRTWTDWIFGIVGGIADFIANFDIYFQMAQQTLVMWAGNALLSFSDLFTNVGIWLNWFSDNWFDVFKSAGNYALTVFQNMNTNIVELFTKLWDWVKGGMVGDFNFDFKSLDDGFKSTVKEWPKFVATELATSTPELDGLAKQLAERRKAMEARRPDGAAADGSASGIASAQRGRGREFDPAFAAVEARSQEAFAALARLQNGSSTNNPQVEAVKNVVKEQQKTNGKLDKVIDTFKGGQMAWEIP